MPGKSPEFANIEEELVALFARLNGELPPGVSSLNVNHTSCGFMPRTDSAGSISVLEITALHGNYPSRGKILVPTNRNCWRNSQRCARPSSLAIANTIADFSVFPGASK